MRYVLRADASVRNGAGHIMRSLALAEALVARRHSAVLMAASDEVPWVREYADDLGVEWVTCDSATIDVEAIIRMRPDVVVIDGYHFRTPDVAELADQLSATVALVDGNQLGLDVSLYVDTNLGSEKSLLAARLGDRMLAGSSFALVRREIRGVATKRQQWITSNPVETRRLRAMLMLGGTDPDGFMLDVLSLFRTLDPTYELVVVSPTHLHSAIRAKAAGWKLELIEPSRDFVQVLSHCDVAISAAGTSAWDLLTIGIPTAFVKVADNQAEGYAAIQAFGLGIGLGTPQDIVRNPDNVAARIAAFWSDFAYMRSMSLKAKLQFDGLGADRLASELERRFS